MTEQSLAALKERTEIRQRSRISLKLIIGPALASRWSGGVPGTPRALSRSPRHPTTACGLMQLRDKGSLANDLANKK